MESSIAQAREGTLRPLARVAALGCAVLALAIVAVAGVVMALRQGPWIDEFSTLWMSEPGVAFSALLRDRLAFDVHPPFYVLTIRAAREVWRSATLSDLRLLNLVPLSLWALYAAWSFVRRPDRRAFVAAAFVFALGGELFGEAMRSLRPYFALICTADLFALAAALSYLDVRADLAPRRSDLAVAAGALVVLMNGHYLAALETGVLVCAFAIALLLSGRGRAAFAALATTAAAFAPSLAFLTWRRAYLMGWTGGGFWIRTDTRAALAVAGWFLPRMTGFNLIAYAALVTTLVRRRRPLTVERRALGEVALIGLAAVAVSLLTLLVVNLQTNIVVERYLTFMGGALAVAMAAAVAEWGRSRSRLYAAALSLSLVSAGSAALAHGRARFEGWNATAKLVAADVRACPGARVDTFHWSDRYFNPLPTDPPVRDYAYAYLAREFGFAQALRRPLAQTNPACPRILWGEHLGPALGLPTETEIMLKLMSGRNAIPQPFIRPDLEVQRGESGYVLLAPPTAHP